MADLTHQDEAGAEERSHQNPVHFLRIYFNFGFFLLLHPFRFHSASDGQNERNRKEYKVISYLPHQILCGMTQFLIIIRLTSKIRKIPVGRISNDPSIYFSLVQSLESLLYHSMFFFMLWFRRSILITSINQIQSQLHGRLPTFGTPYRMIFDPRLIALALCGFYTAKAAMDVMAGYTFVSITSWSPSFLYSAYEEEGRYILFLSPNSSTPEERDAHAQLGIPSRPLTVCGVFIVFLTVTMQFYREVEVHFSDLGILLFTLTLLWHANAFVHNLRQSAESNMLSELKIKEVMNQYESLKGLAKSLNVAFGPVILIFLFEAIPYYSAHLGDFLIITDWFHRLRFFFFMTQFVLILLLAAEIPHKVKMLHDWLDANGTYAKIPHSKLTFLLNEIHSHVIGVSINGVSAISYKLLVTMLSIIVTYFIIMLQFKSVGACHCDPLGNNQSGMRAGMVAMPFIML